MAERAASSNGTVAAAAQVRVTSLVWAESWSVKAATPVEITKEHQRRFGRIIDNQNTELHDQCSTVVSIL